MSFEPTPPTNRTEPFQPVEPEPAAVPTAPVAPAPVTVSSVPGPAHTSSSGGRWLNLVLVLAAAVAIGGVAFAIGRGTAAASANTGTTGNGRVFGGNFPGGSFVPGASGAPRFGRGGGFGGGLTIQGTVESVNGDTVTIKTANGDTIAVTTGASTTYHTQTAATAADVQAGKTVQVQLDGGFTGRPSASAATSAPVGTAGSITVIP
jgi:hypothetical protein